MSDTEHPTPPATNIDLSFHVVDFDNGGHVNDASYEDLCQRIFYEDFIRRQSVYEKVNIIVNTYNVTSELELRMVLEKYRSSLDRYVFQILADCDKDYPEQALVEARVALEAQICRVYRRLHEEDE